MAPHGEPTMAPTRLLHRSSLRASRHAVPERSRAIWPSADAGIPRAASAAVVPQRLPRLAGTEPGSFKTATQRVYRDGANGLAPRVQILKPGAG